MAKEVLGALEEVVREELVVGLLGSLVIKQSTQPIPRLKSVSWARAKAARRMVKHRNKLGVG